MPTVSIVAACYNHASFLRETLESIRTQSFTDWELIFCDDASVDDSPVVAAKIIEKDFPTAKTVFHINNQGLCRTLNEAISLASGKYLQIISCDDILLPEKLGRHVDILEQALPHKAFVHGPIETFGSGIESWKKSAKDRFSRGASLDAPALYRILLDQNVVSAPSALIRMSAVLDVGGYDESLLWEDWDMWLRLAKAGNGSEFDPQICTMYRIHDHNMSSRMDHIERELGLLSILRKHKNNRRAIDHMCAVITNLFRRNAVTASLRSELRSLLLSQPRLMTIERLLLATGIKSNVLHQLRIIPAPAIFDF